MSTLYICAYTVCLSVLCTFYVNVNVIVNVIVNAIVNVIVHAIVIVNANVIVCIGLVEGLDYVLLPEVAGKFLYEKYHVCTCERVIMC